MKTKINCKELVGQTVVVFEPYVNGGDLEKTAKVFSVTSVGPKYITAGGIKFDKELLTNHDCGTRQLFIGTPAEFSQTLWARKRIRKILDNILSNLNDYSLDELLKIEESLEKYSSEEPVKD